MKAAARQALGTDSLKDVSIAIQGFGKVAGYLADHLLVEGARLTVCDINPDATARAKALGSTIVEDPDAIYDVDCDIFAPCALGGSINGNTIDRLRCKMVAGSANNQLLTPEDGEALWKKGVLYVPDYVLNAGGVINLSYEIGRPYQEDEAMERVAHIADSVEKVMSISKDENISTAKAADWLAEMRIKSVRRAKGIYLAP
jgi:leucine dehydrogenase